MIFREKNSIFLIFTLILVDISLILLFLFFNIFLKSNLGDNFIFRNLPTFVNYFIFALTIFIFIYSYFFIYKPMLQIKTRLNNFINNDFKSISLTISEIARGNLTRQIRLEENFLQSDDADMFGFHSLFNTLYITHKEAVYDLNSITSEAGKRLCYVGTDSFLDGKACGEFIGKELKGSGEVAILVKTLRQPSYYLRQKGFSAFCGEKYKGIKIVEVRELFDLSNTSTYKQTLEIIKKYPNLSAIYITGASGFEGAAKAIEESGNKGKIKFICHDITDITAEYLLKGVVTAAFYQNPFAQGYVPIVLIYNYLITKKKPIIKRHLLSLKTITNQNIDQYWSKDRGNILSEEEIKILPNLEENSTDNKFNIGIILADSFFWQVVNEGVKFAAEKLKNYGVSVKVLIPDEFKRGDWSCKAFISAIDSLIKEGVHGIVLPVLDYELIPYLNKKIDEGIIISVVNAEPLSFLGMLNDVSDHALNLFNFSYDLASSSNENSAATEQVNSTMSLIHEETKKQLISLSQTGELISSLEKNISDAIQTSKECMEVSQKNITSANEGNYAVQKNYEAIQSLKISADNTTKIIDALNKDTEKIVDIIRIIDDIAKQINILAINASIQATHASKSGQGFSVVADEIRKLAEKSTKSTLDIQNIVKSISNRIDEATNNISESLSKVKITYTLAGNAESAIKNILKSSIESEEKILLIGDILKQMGETSASVKDAMNEFTQVNSNNKGAIDEITTSINEMNFEVSNISKMAQTLKDMSQSQVDLISQFIITDENKI